MSENELVKCLVWDLDNTLWKGTLSEGDDVTLSAEARAVIETLDSRGILQSIASRNDHEVAWAQLERFGMAEYFVLPEISWGPKSASVRRIADRLRFAPSTIAFVDDQPAERAEVRHHLPMVRCYDAQAVPSLLDRAEFTPRTVTVDARDRRTMYQATFRRDAAKSDFIGSDEEFLRSLDLVMRIDPATGEGLSRVEELTLRTSQMNATGIHYDDETLRTLLADPHHEVLVVSLSDRFGSHGAVGVVLLQRGPSAWRLKLLATSCRVVAFGVGAVLLNWLIDQAARARTRLQADFRRTERNRIMEIAYRFAGFTDMAADDAVGPQAGVQLLEVRPDRRPVPAHIALHAVELWEKRGPGVSRACERG
ncbi:HAD-IIIC family phosphatase [Streptomyces olivaceoviridis]|uniref:HAD-IIIC family phosphatase n=1 Tax=Streptomyces olivaceoviridis TaxID=1921 RepID=UPI0036F4C1B8